MAKKIIKANKAAKWQNDIKHDLGYTVTGEKSRIHAFVGFQKLNGERTHVHPRLIHLRQIEKGGRFITVGADKMDCGILSKQLKELGGMKGLRRFKA